MARRSLFAGSLAAVAAGLMLIAAPAHADAIDGAWCAVDGRTMSIQGPAITTPGGMLTQGNYSRHAFSYVVPEGEANAGETVAMTLLNENTVNVQELGKVETWVRCKPAIS